MTLPSNEDDYVKRVRVEADRYEQTIHAIICFDSAVRFDSSTKDYIPNSHFLPGRRFHDNKKTELTPDVAVQLSNKLGIIGEVKLGASNDRDFEQAANQVAKYDCDLKGWVTGDQAIPTHDIALLIHDFNRNDALRFFKKKNYTRRFSMFACAHVEQASDAFKIEKYHGNLTDKRLNDKFKRPIPVPLEALVAQISICKFCDSEPPVEYTMNVIWVNALRELQNSGKDSTKRTIEVSVKELTMLLRERYSFNQTDDRQPCIPDTNWVRRAMEGFVSIGMAEKRNGNYSIDYSYRRKADMLETFAKKLWKVSQKPKPRGVQLELGV